MDRKLSACKTVNVSILAFYALGIGIFLLFSPKYADDYIFMTFLRPWFEAQGIVYPFTGGDVLDYGLPLDGFWQTWHYHWLTDNTRLGNIVVLFFEILPKWVGSSLCWFCWLAAGWAALNALGVKVLKSSVPALAVFLWTFAMPMEDNMAIQDYQFNYLVPTGIACWLLYILSQGLTGSRKRGSIWLVAAVGVLLGAWHEGFGVPVWCGLAVVVLCFPQWRDKYSYMALICIVLGSLWLLFSPNFFVRVDNEGGVHGFDIKFIMKIALYIHPAFGLFCLLSFIRWIAGGFKSYFTDYHFVFALVSAFVSWVLCAFTSGSPRSGWWCDFISIYGLLRLLIGFFPPLRNPYRWPEALASALLMIASALVIIPADIYVLKMLREYPRIVEKWRENPDEVVYGDVETDMSLPGLARKWLSHWIYWEWAPFQNRYYYGDVAGMEYPIWRVVPESLRNYSPEMGVRLKGDYNPVRVGDFIVMETDCKQTTRAFVDVCYGSVSKPGVMATLVPFAPASGGKNYTFVALYDRWWEFKLFGPTEISNLVTSAYVKLD